MIWEILSCLGCDVEPAQRAGWRNDAAIVWDAHNTRIWSDTLTPDALRDKQFATRQLCMRALRQALPERDDKKPDAYGQLTHITHYPDYVEEFEVIPYHMMNTANYGCFHRAAPNS